MGVPVFAPKLETDHVRPYYDGLAKGELWLSAHPDTGEWLWYPPEVIPGAPNTQLTWKRVSPYGTVYTFTTVTRSLLPGDHSTETPFTVVFVESDDAPGARVPGVLVNAENCEPACGMRVRLAPVKAGDFTIAAFEPFNEKRPTGSD